MMDAHIISKTQNITDVHNVSGISYYDGWNDQEMDPVNFKNLELNHLKNGITIRGDEVFSAGVDQLESVTFSPSPKESK